MNKKRRGLKILLRAVFVAALLLALSSSAAFAQCSMCRSAVSNSTSAAKLARSLNLATLILLIPPVTIFCAFFFAAYRKARTLRAKGGEGEEKVSRNDAGRSGLTIRKRGRTEPDNPSPLASHN